MFLPAGHYQDVEAISRELVKSQTFLWAVSALFYICTPVCITDLVPDWIRMSKGKESPDDPQTSGWIGMHMEKAMLSECLLQFTNGLFYSP